MTGRAIGDVRHALARATRRDHNALHGHVWISRLSAPGLGWDHYRLILGAYCAFFRHVEASRAQRRVFPALSLAPAIMALEDDLADLGMAACDAPVHHAIGPRPERILGALYVLHGAGFGARALAANVDRALPAAPRHYLDAGTSLDLWRALCRALDNCDVDQLAHHHLFNATAATFRGFGSFVTGYCEARDTPQRRVRAAS